MSHSALRQSYDAIARQLGANGAVIEPFESVATVYRHRLYWKPERVSVVLLAESHVFTPADELKSVVDLSRFGFRDAPREYARFVYCLGYGEDAIVEGRVPKNAGTWQFWRLFYACVKGAGEGEAFAPVLKNGTPDPVQRIRNKLAILAEMKRRGIWLVDSSLVAPYVPGASKADPRSMECAIEASWTLFWQRELQARAPRHAICIGLGVYSKLRDRLAAVFSEGVTVVAQPNAWLSGAEHKRNLQQCGEICEQFAGD